ncbi:MAG: DinB family protein [Chitinophagaceae bacterium]
MKEILLSLLENSRGYTLAVAEAMPAKLDNFKPQADIWNFSEQLHHIAYGIEWWKDNYVKGVKTSWEPPAFSKNRKEAVAYLNQTYDSLKDSVNKIPMNDETIKGFFATLDHITHHRGQVIIYLRCNGITAPEYTY